VAAGSIRAWQPLTFHPLSQASSSAGDCLPLARLTRRASDARALSRSASAWLLTSTCVRLPCFPLNVGT